MKTQKLFTLIVLALTVASCVFAQKSITLEELRNMKKKKKAEKLTKKDVPKDMPAPTKTGMVVNLKNAETLAEGSYSKVEKPFIYIARTKEDYNKIKDLVEGFSSDKEIDFNKQAVVAAFGGMKSSGGFSIQVYDLQGRTNILLKSPPKDAMVTQALTYPYKIAVVNVEEESSLNVAVSDDFKSDMTSYKVKNGEFEFEGGFAGMQTKFDVEGTIFVMKHDSLITFLFDMKGKGKESGRVLNEMASGKIGNKNGNMSRVETGNFIDRPHPPLNVSFQLDENKLTMEFEPGKRNYVVNDGFVGKGSLEAIINN